MYGGQTGAITESTFPNAGDAIRYGIVGYRGGNNNVTRILADVWTSHLCRSAGGIEVVIQVADFSRSEHGSYAGCYSEQ